MNILSHTISFIVSLSIPIDNNQVSLPDKRGVALLASLVEAFVTVVSVPLLLLILLVIIKITILNIIMSYYDLF